MDKKVSYKKKDIVVNWRCLMSLNNKQVISVISILLILIISFVLLSGVNVQAYNYPNGKSNESIQVRAEIDRAILCIDEMQQRNLSLTRVNESLMQAIQLYSGQVALENQGRQGNYKVANQSALDVCIIKDYALKADDELKVFKDYYAQAGKKINLSSMDQEYSDIIRSFEEERYEDTSVLIDKGYKALSEVQASQTTLKLFYATTTRTIKDFFIENWKKLTIGISVFIILFFIFWKAIFRYILKRKLDGLYIRRASLEDLIKKMQFDYFKTKKMSEMEFNVKLKSFKEMIRGIDGQIPEIKESLAKVGITGIDKVGKNKEKGGKK